MLDPPLWAEALTYLLCGWLCAIGGMFVGMWLAGRQ
jgi:hypothetical protein